MRKYFMTAFVLAAVLVFATSGLALEKTAARLDSDNADGWNAGSTCTVLYYNTCTGWIWIWTGWNPADQVGVCFDACCSTAPSLTASAVRTWSGSPSGYGFTGTISVNSVDANCCLTGTLASQMFLPVTGWNTYLWGTAVGSSFAVVATLGPGTPNPVAFATDHPAAGPTGPQACGACYLSTRPNHTFYYGTPSSPLCPASPLNDGVCNAEGFSVAFINCPVSVEEATFGKIKGLYR